VSQDDTIWVWDTRDYSHRVSLRLPGSVGVATRGYPVLKCIALSPDQRWLVAAGTTTLLYCWDMSGIQLSFALALPLPAAQFGAVQLHFMPDSRVVAGATAHSPPRL
jgi:WD40 repeat protein